MQPLILTTVHIARHVHPQCLQQCVPFVQIEHCCGNAVRISSVQRRGICRLDCSAHHEFSGLGVPVVLFCNSFETDAIQQRLHDVGSCDNPHEMVAFVDDGQRMDCVSHHARHTAQCRRHELFTRE